MKVLLSIAAVFVVLVGAVVWKGYTWWQANGKQLVAGIQQGANDGAAFAMNADNAACLATGLERYGRDSTVAGMAQGAMFEQACLKKSKPTPGFCDNVPDPKDFTKSREWAIDKCATITSANVRACRGIAGVVPRFCHPRAGDTT
jgi:hypothetical protein